MRKRSVLGSIGRSSCAYSLLSFVLFPSISAAALISGTYTHPAAMYISQHTTGSIDIRSQLNQGGTNNITKAIITFSFVDDADPLQLTSTSVSDERYLRTRSTSYSYPYYTLYWNGFGYSYRYDHLRYYTDYDPLYSVTRAESYLNPYEGVTAGTTSVQESGGSNSSTRLEQIDEGIEGRGSESTEVYDGRGTVTLDLGPTSHLQTTVENDYTEYFGAWSVSVDLGPADLDALTTTGQVDYFVDPEGDFYLNLLTLEYEGEYIEDASGRIPTPGTLLLLMTGIAGLGVFRGGRGKSGIPETVYSMA